jgi:hypothetical protein
VGARNNVGDMENDAFYKFIQKTYPIHPIMMAVALYAVGGFPYVVWGMVIFSTLCLVYLCYSSLFVPGRLLGECRRIGSWRTSFLADKTFNQ